MKKVVVLPGDGIGPEIMDEALKVMKKLTDKFSMNVEIEECSMGGIAIDKFDNPYPEVTEKACVSADSVLLGAVGGFKWDKLEGSKRPEAGLLRLRKSMNAFANLRPALLFKDLKSSSSIKEEVLGDGLDVMVVRELTGGAYFGERGRSKGPDGESAWDTMKYSTAEIERVAHVGFKTAMKRKKKLTLIDKANVLESSRLWRETVTRMSAEYPEVSLDYMYVDNAAMQLVRNPRQFDVILTENLFGDILSDEASMLTGSLGMLPSASIGSGKNGIFEPIHGSAPDIAGMNIANPIGTILSTAMMFKYSFDNDEAFKVVYDAVEAVLGEGYRTADIMQPGMTKVGTSEMGRLVCSKL